MHAMPVSCRRSHSQHLSLFPDCVPYPPPCSLQFLGYGDLASITTACPRLSKLSLTDTSLFKSALAPLAQLSGLKTLHLRNISLFARHAWFTSALACLTRLTDLCISTRERDDAPPAPSLGVPLLEDALIVPLLMQSLCVLELGLDAEFTDSGGTLLANIADLQSLQSVTVRAELRLSVPDFAEPLTLAPSLTTFVAPAATADAGAIKALASVPYVSLWELDPEVDVSNVPCKWVVLSLGRCTSPQQLLYSPKGETMTLNFVEPDALTWVLKAGDGVDVVCSRVQQVSEVLARCGKPYGDRFEVSLGWDNGDVSPSAGARLIAALAPLGGKCLNLSLDHDVAEQWQLNGEQARQLRQHLPNVKQLTLNPTAPGFDQFAAALADAIPELSTLRFGHWVDELTPQARDALLAMAVARARAGLMMKIYTGQLLTLEQRLSMNELIRGHADAVGEGVMVWFVGEDGV